MGGVMKTTLYLDRELLNEVMAYAQTNNIAAAVEIAMKAYIKKQKINDLIASFGSFDLIRFIFYKHAALLNANFTKNKYLPCVMRGWIRIN